MTTTDLHLTDAAVGQNVALLAYNAQLNRGQGKTDIDVLNQVRILGRRHRLAVGGELIAIETMNQWLSFDRTEGHRYAGLGHPINREHRRTLEPSRPEQVTEAPHHSNGNGLSTVAKQTHAGKIGISEFVRCHPIQNMLKAEVW